MSILNKIPTQSITTYFPKLKNIHPNASIVDIIELIYRENNNLAVSFFKIFQSVEKNIGNDLFLDEISMIDKKMNNISYKRSMNDCTLLQVQSLQECIFHLKAFVYKNSDMISSQFWTQFPNSSLDCSNGYNYMRIPGIEETSKLYNLLHESSISLSKSEIGSASIFLHKKKAENEDSSLNAELPRSGSLIQLFKGLKYSETSNYLIELILTTYESKGKQISRRILQKAINLREVINIKNTEEHVQVGNSISIKLVRLNNIKDLSIFLSRKIKSSNVLNISASSKDNEYKHLIHPVYSDSE